LRNSYKTKKTVSVDRRRKECNSADKVTALKKICISSRVKDNNFKIFNDNKNNKGIFDRCRNDRISNSVGKFFSEQILWTYQIKDLLCQ